MQWLKLWGVEKDHNFCAECNNTVDAGQTYCKQHQQANVKWICNKPLLAGEDNVSEDTYCEGQVTFLNDIAVCNTCNRRSKERALSLTFKEERRDWVVGSHNLLMVRKRVAEEHTCEWTKRRK